MKNDHIDRIREQFTRTADVYARMRQTTDERGLEALVGLSGASSSDRVLDVACGPGFLTMAFARKCREATGFDATDAFLRLARAEAKVRDLGNLCFEYGDAEDLPFSDASFEVVSCRAAFHHFRNPAAAPAPKRAPPTADRKIFENPMKTAPQYTYVMCAVRTHSQ